MLSTLAASGQDFQSEFRRQCAARDTAAARQTLVRWQKQRPQDPDYYVARFNQLLEQAERVMVSRQPANGRGLTLTDSLGNTAGSISSGWDPTLIERACATLRRGVDLAPNRLDMRFGLAKAYEVNGQPEAQVQVLREALAYRAAAGSKPWRWRDGEALPAPEEAFVPGCLEDYASTYWQEGSPEGLETGRQLTELLRQYYPKSSLGPFNLGVYYGIKGQPEQAYTHLKQADALQPNDLSTVANLAKICINAGRKAEAQAYLARLRKLPGSRQAATELSAALRQLK